MAELAVRNYRISRGHVRRSFFVIPCVLALLPVAAEARGTEFDLAAIANSKIVDVGTAGVSNQQQDPGEPDPTAAPDKAAATGNAPDDASAKNNPVMGPTLPQAHEDSGNDLQTDLTSRERKFKRTNEYLEVTYQILNLADMVETVSCLSRHICVENNPILGKHPSTGTVVGFKVASGLLHYALYRSIINHPRKVRTFEYISIAIQAGAVISNLRVVF